MIESDSKSFAFQWHITDLCNLRCRHCYQDRFDRARDLPIEDWVKIIHNIISTLETEQYSGLSINITGGEPLISPLFYPIMDVLEDYDFVKEVNIITNGLELGVHAKKLGEYKKYRHLKVSLEGALEETNDSIRGSGNFQRVLKNMEALDLEFLLMFTLAKYNLAEIEEMHRLAEETGAKGLILERFVPLGAGGKIRDCVLDAMDWEDVLIRVSHRAECEPETLIPYKAFLIDLQNDSLLGALCNLGDEAMALMPNADVYPCRRLPIVIGNLRKGDFSGILKNLGLFREQFDDKSLLRGNCHDCPEAGCIGCRALAYALGGDLFGGDMQCRCRRP